VSRAASQTATDTTTVPSAGVPAAAALPADLEVLLRRLRLPHIRRHAPEVVATTKAQRWEPVEVLRALLTEEAAGRERSALATPRAAAAFPTGKTFAAWRAETSSIPAPTQSALRTLEWVGRRENLVVCGPSGTGKTFLLEALGQQAVEAGLKAAWFTLKTSGCCYVATAPTTPSPEPSTECCAPTWSWSTTSGCSRSPRTPPKASTASSTPPTRNARSRYRATCTPPRSTSSCP